MIQPRVQLDDAIDTEGVDKEVDVARRSQRDGWRRRHWVCWVVAFFALRPHLLAVNSMFCRRSVSATVTRRSFPDTAAPARHRPPRTGGGARAIATHLGPTADGGGGVRDSNTSDLRPTRGGGVRAIVTHPGPTADGGGRRARSQHTPDLRPTGGGYARDRNTSRTYDRRGCLKNEDKYASGLMLRRTGHWKTGQSGLKPDEWPPYWAAWAYSEQHFNDNVAHQTPHNDICAFTMQSRSYTATRYYMKKRTVDICGLFISRYTVLRYIVTSLLLRYKLYLKRYNLKGYNSVPLVRVPLLYLGGTTGVTNHFYPCRNIFVPKRYKL